MRSNINCAANIFLTFAVRGSNCLDVHDVQRMPPINTNRLALAMRKSQRIEILRERLAC